MDTHQLHKYKPIIKGTILGGIFGIIGLLIAPLGLGSAFIEFIRPVLIPGIDLIVNPYFNPGYKTPTIFGTTNLLVLGIVFNVLIYAILGGILASIGSVKGLPRVIKILFIVVVIAGFLLSTMTFQTIVTGIRYFATKPPRSPINCDSQERAAFSEFPHYGNTSLEPRTEGETGYCRDEFISADSGEQIMKYYQEQLIARGWTTEVKYSDFVNSFNKASQQWEKKPANIYDLTGIRNEFYYIVEINDLQEGRATGVFVRTGRRQPSK